ncbi:haloacid dehalogenase superfamily, subfamily IA, variant 3 with third motif having DD or ED [Blastococcus aurantiacus]|uniref:Haloacid dehalogenase superfamily, subfamily IA, variant 3 with third motif having DD or ED n=1 Tax=Blastococcus aurantiacus TaxID=1550231 RepID=A0A1G7LUU8_9ACTN|nr:HAD family phosphatase [Blastococcus aurantiacus]SDF53144.1 haloacid dehalogenase superfamily, subfamily IA, variant 3 with third motif having DD or ED [Blastococcus aurantiacus]
MTGTVDNELGGLRALLLDADDTLVPSEVPAFEASAEVTNRLLAAAGIDRRVTGEELRSEFTGKNFRTTARELAAAAGVEVPDLETWVAEEKRAVTGHLSAVLRPDPEVFEVLRAVSSRLELAAVSSSALARLDGSFRAAGLADLLPPARRFSAEDSLPTPTSKPDPAVYLHACRELGIEPAEGLAVEDSVSGATSAVRAGCPTVGIVAFVPEAEQADRRRRLEDAGAFAVVGTWRELGDLLLPALREGVVG